MASQTQKTATNDGSPQSSVKGDSSSARASKSRGAAWQKLASHSSGKRPIAETTSKGSTFDKQVHSHPDRSIIEAHEAVHREQFSIGHSANSFASRSQLEAEADVGSAKINKGQSFTAKHAAHPSMRLFFDPDESFPMEDSLLQHGQQERTDLQTLNPLPGQEPEQRVEMTRSTDHLGEQRVLYDLHTAAEGQNGSVDSHTLLKINMDPNDPHQWLTPTNIELGLQWDPEYWKMYPVNMHYDRRIVYTDNHGRTLEVNLNAQVWFTYDQWFRELDANPDLSLDALSRFQGDGAYMTVTVDGQGDLEALLNRDYPDLPASVREELLEDHIFYYFNTTTTTGNSLDAAAHRAAYGLTVTGPSFPITLSESLASFVYLDKNAASQYDAIRNYLESHDAVHVQKWIQWITERLMREMMDSSSGWGILDDIAAAWGSLPAWLRGTLKTVGKTILMVGAVIGVAALIVLAAPVELTVAGVALAIGVAMMIGTFFYSIYQRSVESVRTGEGGPLGIFLTAIADTIGISGIYEGSQNESILTGTPLGMNEEQQWETGTSGVVQLFMTVLGIKALRGRGRPAGPGQPAAEPATITRTGQHQHFHELPQQRLPQNLPDGYYWTRNTQQNQWVLMRDAGTPEIPLELTVFADGAGNINYTLRTGNQTIQTNAVTREGGVYARGQQRLPRAIDETGVDNPYLDPVTGRPWDKGHGIDYADTMEGPGVRSSTTDISNFVPQATWWNQGARRILVDRIRNGHVATGRTGGGGYREMAIYPDSAPATINGTPIPSEFIFVETTRAGVPIRAWRIPNQMGATGRSYNAIQPYEVNLNAVPEIMVRPNAPVQPPPVNDAGFIPFVVYGARGSDESTDD